MRREGGGGNIGRRREADEEGKRSFREKGKESGRKRVIEKKGKRKDRRESTVGETKVTQEKNYNRSRQRRGNGTFWGQAKTGSE